MRCENAYNHVKSFVKKPIAPTITNFVESCRYVYTSIWMYVMLYGVSNHRIA